MQNVIVIYGCSSLSEEQTASTKPTERHWVPWLKDVLTARGIVTATPQMPESWRPDYQKYKAEFEKQHITEETTLVGHSCGCAFLVRWLGDSKQKIDKLILVAPWKIAADKSEKEMFYEYDIDPTIRERVKEIIYFTADDEEEDGKRSLDIFHNALGGKIIELKGRGHYVYDDMGTDAFPELVAAVIS